MTKRVAAVAALVLAASSADASVGLFGNPNVAIPEAPYLSVEQSLVIWDSESHVEHLIRELRFQNAKSGFGYIVPTPTKPEVSKVDTAPFVALRAGLPFEPSLGLGMLGGGGLGAFDHGAGTGGGGPPQSAAPAPEPVEVIQQLALQSFTAFVVAARDTASFTKWLTDNKLAIASDMEPWIARYVLLGFHFVVLRFDASDKPFASETVRITFAANAPYYPYVEPTRTNPALWLRRLAVWYAAREPRMPITLRDGVAVRPWRAGARYTPTRELLSDAIGSLGALLPAAKTISLQTFEDRKLTRAGFSDVVLIPDTPQPADAIDRRDVAAWLDPSLVPPPAPPAPSPAPVSAPSPIASPSATGFHTTTCAYGRAALGPEWMLLAAAILLHGRKRAIAIALTVVGCKQNAPPPPPPAPSASVVASVVPSAPSVAPIDSAKLAELDAILRGVVVSASVVAQEPGQPWDPPPVLIAKKAPAKTNVVSVAVSGGLAQEIVNRYVRRIVPRLRRCHEIALAADPKSEGTLNVRLLIAPNGSVTNAVSGGGTLAGVVMSCTLASFRTLAFPEAEKPTAATVSLRFSPP